MRPILGGAAVLLLIFAIVLAFPGSVSAPPGAPQVAAVSSVPPPAESASLFLVGDIMLGRAVEGLMDEHGAGYPFEKVEQFIAAPDLAVGNFEGVVSREHVRAPSMTFQFSIKNEYLTELRDVGFDVLSLANNHSLDYGEEALGYTKELCAALALSCGGFPDRVGDDSLIVREVRGHTVAFVLLSTVWGDIDEEALAELLARAVAESDFLIAYVHWGEEYALTHGKRQEALAHALIEGGVDAVIGHHPHVIEDVELYRGKPIFYSLGNFIFDQYFSADVMEGLGIGVLLTDDTVRYRLIPFVSDGAPSQPRTALTSEAERLFARILSGIADAPGVDAKDGLIILPREASRLHIPAM